MDIISIFFIKNLVRGKKFYAWGKTRKEDISMFILGLLLGLVLGANISLFLYAIIFLGKKSEDMENDR